MELSAQDATTSYDCRVNSCPNSAKSNRGRNAYLCDYHLDLRRQGIAFDPPEHEPMPLLIPQPVEPETPAEPETPKSFEEHAQTLVDLAREADRCVAAAKVAIAAYRRALADG